MPVSPHEPTGESGRVQAKGHTSDSLQPPSSAGISVEITDSAKGARAKNTEGTHPTHESKEWADGKKRVSYDEDSNETIEIRARGLCWPLRSRRGDRISALSENGANGKRPENGANGKRPTDVPIAGMTEEDRLWAEGAERERRVPGSSAHNAEVPPSSPESVTDDEIFGPDSDFDPADAEALERAMGPEEGDPFWSVEENLDVEQEEAAPRRTLRDPGEPTKEEWEEHRIDHVPYRSWCPYCVRGRGSGVPHKRVEEESRIPTFGFDYLHGSEGETATTPSRSWLRNARPPNVSSRTWSRKRA